MVLLADSLTKSERFSRRYCLGKQAPSADAATGTDSLFTGNLNRETLTPLGTTALDHQTAILGGHTNQKTVGTLTGSIAGLKCSFHG